MDYAETYKEVKKERSFSSRKVLRTNVLSVLSTAKKIQGFRQEFRKPRVHFLYFHHLFKDEEDTFELLLKRLSKEHTFITYSEAVEKILNRNINKPCIVLSSDDGFKNNLTAAKILNEYGVKACFFINPYSIEQSNFKKIKQFCRKRINFPPVRFLDWDDVETLQKMGHEIGSHTMNHINIAETSVDRVRVDMEKTYEILKQRCGDARHFAFPYGKFSHFTEEARKIVFKTGFTSCASAERGCHINPPKKLSRDELCIRRDHAVFGWPINHLLYFIAKSSKNANATNNLFPYSST